MSKNLRQEAGHWEAMDFAGKTEAGGTRVCCHCGAHWIYTPGSGILRGFCQNCAGYVCGPGCAECVPMEQKLENSEAGLPECHKPVKIFVPPGIRDIE